MMVISSVANLVYFNIQSCLILRFDALQATLTSIAPQQTQPYNPAM